KTQVGLETFANKTRCGNVNGIEGLDNRRHRSSRPFDNRGRQSGFCNDTFQPAKLNSGIRNIVISPVVFKPHSIDETPALYTNECARICLFPVSPAFPRIFLTPKDTKDNARINVEVHDRSVRISASIRSTSTFFSRFSGFTFLAAAGGSIASSIIRSSSDRKSTRLNSSHEWISYAVFCLK